MNCIPYLVLVVVAVIFGGCNGPPRGGSTVENARIISFDELQEATQDLLFFGYVGSDDHHHFFRVDQLGYFRVARSTSFPDFRNSDDLGISIGDVEVFVTIKDGKLTAPDPKDMVDH